MNGMDGEHGEHDRTARDITTMVRELGSGHADVAEHLLPLIYDELRRLAEAAMRRERPDHTLQATAVVHEAYLRLVDQRHADIRDRSHFFALAAIAIRRLLVDHARGRDRLKRGGGRARLSLDAVAALHDDPGTDLVELDHALTALARIHADKARIVEMRFFGGLTNEEAAQVLGISTRTVERHWQFARAWLYRALTESADEP